MTDEGKRSVLVGVIGAAVLLLLFSLASPLEKKIATAPQPLAAIPEAVEPTCPPGTPTLSTPDGAVTCCGITQIRRYPSRPPAPPTRYGWNCPPGWRVEGGQVVP